MVSDRAERGQLILIGAISLAFIILGVVVVFNGVLYTENLSSGGTSQSASTAQTVEIEVEKGVGCLLEQINDDADSNLQTYAEENISTFSDAYRNTTARSTPAVVTISHESTTVDPLTSEITQSEVTITYDSSDLHYVQNRTVEPGCP